VVVHVVGTSYAAGQHHATQDQADLFVQVAKAETVVPLLGGQLSVKFLERTDL
jgi:hypothetical protein